jgi:hypothetical protein
MGLNADNVRLYRQFVYGDADNPHPIPDGLLKVHEELFSQQAKYTGRSMLSVDAHSIVFLFWKYSTNDGRAFYGMPLIKYENAAVVHNVVPTSIPVEQDRTPPGRTPVRASKSKGALAPARKPSIWAGVALGTPVNAKRQGESFGGEFAGAGPGGIRVKTANGTIVKCHPSKVTLV